MAPSTFILRTTQALVAGMLLLCGSCATINRPASEGDEPVLVHKEAVPAETEPETDMNLPAVATADKPEANSREPTPSAEPEGKESIRPPDELAEVLVQAPLPARPETIRGRMLEAQNLLRKVDLKYVFTGQGKSEVLRGRPVAFALWSEAKKQWVMAQVEIARPPVKWKPGGKPLPVTVLTPGITAQHVKGTGAERLMFTFERDGEALKVYGRKFPVFDNDLIKRKQWRAVVESASPIIYLPFTEDTLDPYFIDSGREFLLATARRAAEELRSTGAPSMAFPKELLADIVPPEVITTLAVIEQTDDADYAEDPTAAYSEVLNQYGLKREEAYRYSVSRASAIGPMQFTNKRGNGTYAMVVRRCPAAKLDPNFERGATDLLNVMKAAICLFDSDLSSMRAEIRNAYHDNRKVLGIFPVASYNGGSKNVTRLFNVIKKMKLELNELRPPGMQPAERPVTCPCLWRNSGTGAVPVTIPKYNNENRWYVEKYQSILRVFTASR